MKPPKRIVSLFAFVTCILVGLASRRYAIYFPDLVNTYLGDAIWAMMVYFLMQSIFIGSNRNRILLFTMCFCFFIELSQLYHAPWIDGIRHTTLGGLVLGFGFLWSDILAYTFGAIGAYLLSFQIKYP
ncbi:MAG: hypothetical protein CFE21_14060 [Bacteroidetes bacterium B1(2017)]|nr:MAG: hypothetical protein CFE21_14060 [Bacteroidetes bacterium B1(2017)]